MDDRAVSETLGFVFAFALVTASVGVVYTTGIGGLEDAQDDEQLTNAVRAFDVLADNVRDVTEKGAPSRATELKLSDATLRFGEPSHIKIRASNSGNASDSTPYNATVHPLIYDAEGGEVVYSAGATFRVGDGGAAVMRTEPRFIVDDGRQPNTTVIPLVKTFSRGTSEGIRGSGTALIVAHRQPPELNDVFSTDRTDSSVHTNVTITVESPRAEAWGRYFEKKGMHPADSSDDDSVTYWFHTDKLVVPDISVALDIKR